jgi:dipeptidyl aminopeptidase/acylaminoacyl peptidase
VPDARVQAAIDNWGSRMIANGVDYNDFRRVTSSLEHWDDWLDAWKATADGHREDAERAREAGHDLTAGEAYVRAAVCHHFAKFVWVLDIERNRAATEQAIAALAAGHALLDPTAERVEAPLDGAQIAANLRRPRGVERPPLIVLIPGLDSTKEEFFHWESVFLERGMATVSLDGPGQGESGFALDIRPDYEVAVAALLDALGGRDDVELDRVGAAGVSMGGYYAPRAAAFEPRLRAVAGVAGPYNFGELWDDVPMLTREAFVHYSRSADDEAGRRGALQLDLAGVAGQIEQPALLVTGKLDRLIPWESTRRIADEAPNATLVVYEEGNHVCNNVAYRYRPLLADWLGEQLSR